MSLCKWNKKGKPSQKLPRPFFDTRLQGGAATEMETQIIVRAVENAKIHGIDVHAGPKNLANGNCLIESIIDSINVRSCFSETIEETPDHWRNKWLEEVENIGYGNWNNGLTMEEWKEGWELLRTTRIYEHDLGDLVLPGIAHCVKKGHFSF